MWSVNNQFRDLEKQFKDLWLEFTINFANIDKSIDYKIINKIGEIFNILFLFSITPLMILLFMRDILKRQYKKNSINEDKDFLLCSIIATIIVYAICYFINPENTLNILLLHLKICSVLFISCILLIILQNKYFIWKIKYVLLDTMKYVLEKDLKKFLLEENALRKKFFIQECVKYITTPSIFHRIPVEEDFVHMYFYDFYIYKNKEEKHIFLNVKDMEKIAFMSEECKDFWTYTKKEQDVCVFINYEIDKFAKKNELKELVLQFFKDSVENNKELLFTNEIKRFLAQITHQMFLTEKINLIEDENNPVKRSKKKI